MSFQATDVNRTLDSGRKPLHIVADFGQKDVMEFLISTGADVNVGDRQTRRWEGMCYSEKITAFLSLQATDKHGLTPLICACLENHVACVKLLLEKVGGTAAARVFPSLGC